MGVVAWAIAIPALAGTLPVVSGAVGGPSAQALQSQIASPENGYFSPRAQFNGAGVNVTSPMGGYGANGFLAPSGQVMTSPQGAMGGGAPSPNGGMGAP